MSLAGRVAAITGASAGIGLACATHLAREGMAVVLGARRTPLLEAAANAIRGAGGRAAVVPMDVTSEADNGALVQKAIAEFGRLDVMICNAGFGFYGPIDDTPPDIMRRMMEVNYMGTFLARGPRSHFRARNSGHSSSSPPSSAAAALRSWAGHITATKAAQAGLASRYGRSLLGRPSTSRACTRSRPTPNFDL